MILPPIIKRLLMLLSGAALGNLIVLAATPILTRLYGPDDFGLLAMFASTSGILGAVFCLRYEQAVYIPRTDRTALLLVAGGLFCAAIFLVLFTGIGALILWVFDETALGAWWLAVPLAGALLAVYNLLSNWAVRRHRVAIVVRTRVSRAVMQVCVQGGAGVTGFVPGGLMAGDLAGRVAGVWVLGRLFISARESVLLSAKRVWFAMRRYRRFPLVAAPGALVNVMVMQGVPLVLAFVYSPSVAGIYFLVQRLMAAPLALVGQSVAQVLTSELARKLASGDRGCFRLYARAVVGLAILGGIPIALVGVFAGPYLPTILGVEWRGSGDFLLALTPFFVGQFVVSPLANFMNALGRQGGLFTWDLLRLLVAFPVLILPDAFGWSVELAISLFSWVMFAFYILLSLWLGKLLWQEDASRQNLKS
ncbi:lipopolysaccharide biosynthesis protein [Marinobacter sp. C1S70]|uniref:lipopolysaccharide biosynthesis protein n=1 Tax=Marinobacter sp. C1S70 TaxID=1396859 RepID=UPI0004BAFBA7|nr:lipopolysaccharide biosynthesis protein [Marinobacter sp. C1S70]